MKPQSMVLTSGASIFYFWYRFNKAFCENNGPVEVNWRAVFCIALSVEEAEKALTDYYISNFDVVIEEITPKSNDSHYAKLVSFHNPQDIMGFEKYVTI